MKRVALWIMTITFAFLVMSSAPVHSAVKWDRGGPQMAASSATTIPSGEGDPTESGTGDDGDADGVAGIKSPSRGVSAVPEMEQRFILMLRSWWMLFLQR